MKKLIVGILISFLLLTSMYASGTSTYDKRWNITVSDCSGNKIVYYNCALTNQGEFVVSFIPNAGRVSDPRGPEVMVHITSCNSVIMSEDL